MHCGDYATGGFIAYLTTLSTDAESGVRGYQVRVRGPNGAILRDFPAAGAVDLPASQVTPGRGIRLPLTVTTGGNHRVEVRAINGAGVAGDVNISGEILVDVTPPPAPGVVADRQMSAVRVRLTITADPESGTGGVDIAFGTSPTVPAAKFAATQMLLPYTTYPAPVGSNQLILTLPADVLAEPMLYVYVRMRNGAGLSSTAVVSRVY
jgi:hypothetical protein